MRTSILSIDETRRRFRRRVDAGKYGAMILEVTPHGLWFRYPHHATKYFLQFDMAAGAAIRFHAERLRLDRRAGRNAARRKHA